MNQWTDDESNDPAAASPPPVRLTLDDPLPVLSWSLDREPADPEPESPVETGETESKKRRWPLVLAGLFTVMSLMAMSAGVAYWVAKNTEPQTTAVATAAPTPTPTVTPAVVPIIESAGIDGEPYAQAAALVTPSVVRVLTDFGVGSGVVYDESGLIMTAAHVVDTVDTVEILLSDGSRVAGEVIGTHELSDIGVIKIDPPDGLSVARLADSSDVTVGQAVVALGSPFGLEQTVTAGIVSAVDRIVSRIPMVQTDAAINPGNSGGPLVNLSGEVIGISSQIFTESGDNAGVGFAVSIDLAKLVAEQLIAGEDVELALLGVTSSQTDDGSAGAQIVDVLDGTAAADSGLQVGDVVTAIDDLPIRSSGDLRAEVLVRAPGSAATLTVVRGGEPVEIEVVFGSTD